MDYELHEGDIDMKLICAQPTCMFGVPISDTYLHDTFLQDNNEHDDVIIKVLKCSEDNMQVHSL